MGDDGMQNAVRCNGSGIDDWIGKVAVGGI